VLKAYLHPKKKPNDRHWYAYDVAFDGEIIVTDSRDPEHDLARALLARGIKDNVTLHDGSTRKPRTVGRSVWPSVGRYRDWQRLVAYRTGRTDPSFLLQFDGKTHMTDIIPTAAEAKCAERDERQSG
jgi:hypothetical protein